MRLTLLLPSLLPFTVSVAAQRTPLGCFNDPGSLQSQGSYTYQSVGYCADLCGRNGRQYAAPHQDECYCGDTAPGEDAKVSDAECNAPCPGMATDSCGGKRAWSVYMISGGGHIHSSSSTLTNSATSTSTTSGDTETTPSTAASLTSSASSSAGVSESASEVVASSSPPTSTSTSLEPTPTENSATRRYSFLF
ncbi:WSC domain-containing protein [Aspergillus lucknowensis]|uniref:WSC domain-containing protein n=1 Tax=Aspergillus lucknowensis TaxID=176173 RepID=A0ABR4M4B6_9EURO